MTGRFRIIIFCPEDREYILLFIDTKRAVNNISIPRSQKIASTLLGWRKTVIDKSFPQLTYPELLKAIRDLNIKKNQNGEPFSQNTKHDYIREIKSFLIWMVEEGYNPNFKTEKIKEIKVPREDKNTRHPDDILKPEEIIKLLDASLNSRDRALMALQYELGTRIWELCNLTWNDIQFDKNPQLGAVIYIYGKKTDRVRYGVSTAGLSYSYLIAWRNDYPGEPYGDNPVFVKLKSDKLEFLEYGNVRRIFLDAKERAKISKRVYSHLFRATRITHYVEQGLSEGILKEAMWGNQSSNQLKNYISMSPDEEIKALRRHMGIEVDELLKPRCVEGSICPEPMCKRINSPTASFCQFCGAPLHEESKNKINDRINDIFDVPEYIQKIIKQKEDDVDKLKSYLTQIDRQ